MTVIISLLFYLYVLFIILAILALLFATPPIIERFAWLKDKSSDEKVLVSLPIHLILIILAVVSVWKFQYWRIDYEIRSGHAPIEKVYRNLLVKKYPELGATYQRIIAEKFLVDQHVSKMSRFQHSLNNHYKFITDHTRRLQMVSDQLKNLRSIIETKAKSHKNTHDAAKELSKEIKVSVKRIYQNKKRINDLITEHARRSIRFLTHPELNDPHYPVSQKNYDRLISFFLSEHSDRIDQLNLITQTIITSNVTMKQLKDKLAQRGLQRRQTVYDVLYAWGYTKKYARVRLFKILYALETEYVLQAMGISDEVPIMKQLHSATSKTIQDYSEDVLKKFKEVNRDSNPNTALKLH